MNAMKTVLAAGLLMTVAAAAAAENETPEWQVPGYVMDEIVVTAPRPPARPVDRKPVARISDPVVRL
jgi:hypothetical protein